MSNTNKIRSGLLILTITLLFSLAKIGKIPILIDSLKTNSEQPATTINLGEEFELRKKNLTETEKTKEEISKQKIKDNNSKQPDSEKPRDYL